MPCLRRAMIFLGCSLGCAGAFWPGQGRAHAILMESQPPAGATLTPGPATLVLRFNSRIDQARSRIMLRAGTAEFMLPLNAVGNGDILAAPAILAPGAYVMRWQVLAVDGHITRGDVPFTVEER